MAQFVPVPAQEIEGWLQSRGFERGVQRQEVVYTRRSRRNRDVVMKVYTSVRDGRDVVRASGKDAIRVCVVFDDGRKSFGIGKFPPVLRVTSAESVLRRLRERLGEAAARANEWLNENERRFGRRHPREPAPPPPPPAMDDKFNEEWIRLKNEFAREEARQEAAAYAAEMEAEIAAERASDDRRNFCPACGTQRCPDGCCCGC